MKKNRPSTESREEKDLLKSVERGEWRTVPRIDQEKKRYRRYAAAALRKDRRINIRLPEGDLVLIQQRALEEGLPYQTLIASILHKFASGRLRSALSDSDSSSERKPA